MMTFGPTASLPTSAAPFWISVSIPGLGEPIIFRAIPSRFEFRAEHEPFAFNSVPGGFTFRGRA